MSLNISKGNMYDFVTHTWNTIKGACYHDCSYCYMKRWGKLNPVRFDEKELKTDLGENNFIFVGSSCDMFGNGIPFFWKEKTLEHCCRYDNEYLFQTKSPLGMYLVESHLPEKSIVCITIETNRYYPSIMNKSPQIINRMFYLQKINKPIYITIEPIMYFDLDPFSEMLKICNPIQINIGADSGNNNLPEPPKEKILELITELEKFTKVKLKKNLKRLIE